MRLNLGAGDSPIEGYDNSWDISQGKKAFPLDLPDGVADEIRASHLLEHFNHRGAKRVVAEWTRVLKTGGLLKVAVPDFEQLARDYLAGKPGNYQGWLSGGQVDDYDIHLAQYDRAALANLMRACGLAGIHTWEGDGDCSTFDFSLNLAGWKRPAAYPRTLAVMSRPRLGFMDQFGCAMEALMPRGIPVYSRTGVYWGKCMTLAIEAALGDGAEWILALDYDTLFSPEDIDDLLMFMWQRPDCDALVPVQMHRMNDQLLMNPKEGTTGISRRELEQPYYPIRTGHFGCTLFRAEVFRKLGKPWFSPTFHPNGDSQYDEDIKFWLAFEEAGMKAMLAPRVTVGHLECVVMWPDRELKLRYQKANDWREKGRPTDAWR